MIAVFADSDSKEWLQAANRDFGVAYVRLYRDIAACKDASPGASAIAQAKQCVVSSESALLALSNLLLRRSPAPRAVELVRSKCSPNLVFQGDSASVLRALSPWLAVLQLEQCALQDNLVRISFEAIAVVWHCIMADDLENNHYGKSGFEIQVPPKSVPKQNKSAEIESCVDLSTISLIFFRIYNVIHHKGGESKKYSEDTEMTAISLITMMLRTNFPPLERLVIQYLTSHVDAPQSSKLGCTTDNARLTKSSKFNEKSSQEITLRPTHGITIVISALNLLEKSSSETQLIALLALRIYFGNLISNDTKTLYEYLPGTVSVVSKITCALKTRDKVRVEALEFLADYLCLILPQCLPVIKPKRSTSGVKQLEEMISEIATRSQTAEICTYRRL